jgi:hypothetical protein
MVIAAYPAGWRRPLLPRADAVLRIGAAAMFTGPLLENTHHWLLRAPRQRFAIDGLPTASSASSGNGLAAS